MLGKTHMAVAVAVYSSMWLPRSTGEFGPWAAGLGTVIVTSLLPDVDEPRSFIGKIMMPLVPMWLRPVAFLLIGGFLAWTAGIAHPYIALYGLILVICALMKHRNSPTHSWIIMTLVSVLLVEKAPGLWKYALLGSGTHLVLDMITEGIPLFWPFKFWVKFQITSTGSLLEKWIFYRGAQVWAVAMIFLVYGSSPVSRITHLL